MASSEKGYEVYFYKNDDDYWLWDSGYPGNRMSLSQIPDLLRLEQHLGSPIQGILGFQSMRGKIWKLNRSGIIEEIHQIPTNHTGCHPIPTFPIVHVTIDSREYRLHVDTGSSKTFLNANLFTGEKDLEYTDVIGFTGHTFTVRGRACQVSGFGNTTSISVYEAPHHIANADGTLGADFMLTQTWILDLANQELYSIS